MALNMNLRPEVWLKDLNMKPTTYFMLIFAAIMGLGVFLPYILMILFPHAFTGVMIYALYILPIFCIFVIILIPLLATSKKKGNIERNMPLFVTQMAALSTSDMSFENIFLILSERTEYGELAKDAKKIYRLIKDYKVGASEACRFVATRSSAPMESDFFNRLSHALDVGEKMDRFMKNEHDVIMDEYILKSDSSIKDLDFIKEIYTGIVTSLIFTAVFISITPLLGGGSVDLLLYGIVIAFAAMEGFFIYFIQAKVPKDDIWYAWRHKFKSGYMTDTDRILITSVLIAILGIVLLAFVMIPTGLPPLFIASTIFLPVIIPGILIGREERRVQKRDNLYGAFIRSLGRSSEMSGTTVAEAVKKLSMHTFGPLTVLIRNLSKRLNMHINTTESWRHFASESSSNLINKFGEMYTQCVQNGAKAEPTSIFISNNMFKILSIRKKRQILASSFVGVVYGVMISLAFTLWITIGIVDYMGKTMAGLVAQNPDIVSGGFLSNMFNATYNVSGLETMAFVIILLHAFLSSLMLPMLRGGHIAGAVIHFVALIWIGSLASLISQAMLSGLLV